MTTRRNSASTDAALVPDKQEQGLNAHARRMRGRQYTGHLDGNSRGSVSHLEYQRLRDGLKVTMSFGEPVVGAIYGFEAALEDGDEAKIDSKERILRAVLERHDSKLSYIERIQVIQAVRQGFVEVLREEAAAVRKATQEAAAAKSAEGPSEPRKEATIAHTRPQTPEPRILPLPEPTFDDDKEVKDTGNLAHYVRRSQGVRLAIKRIHAEYPIASDAERRQMEADLATQLTALDANEVDTRKFVQCAVTASMKDVGILSGYQR